MQFKFPMLVWSLNAMLKNPRPFLTEGIWNTKGRCLIADFSSYKKGSNLSWLGISRE